MKEVHQTENSIEYRSANIKEVNIWQRPAADY